MAEPAAAAVAGRRVPVADLVALGLAILIAGAAASRALGYGMWNYFEPGPGLFPLLACALAVVAALLSIGESWFGKVPAPIEGDAEEDAGPIGWRRLLVYVAVVLGWPWLLAPLGFLLSTALSLLVLLRIGERMAWPGVALVLVGALGASWLVFERLLGVPLPRGAFGLG